MQEGKYDKAHAAFDKMLAAGAGDLSDRVADVQQRVPAADTRGRTRFASHEEHYDYAVSLLNDGHYEDAREQFKLILKAERQGRLRSLRACGAGEHDGRFASLPGASDGGDPAESAEPDSGASGLGFSGHGGRSAVHGAPYPEV